MRRHEAVCDRCGLTENLLPTSTDYSLPARWLEFRWQRFSVDSPRWYDLCPECMTRAVERPENERKP